MTDLSDLAEILFPNNRNHQHAFLVIWVTLKWARASAVPDLAEVATKHGVSRRTLQRVRAKMRRMGLIEYVSRMGRRHGYREGWALSSRAARALHQLADEIEDMSTQRESAQDKDAFMV